MCSKRLKKNRIIIRLLDLKRINIRKMNNSIKWSEIDFKKKKIKNTSFKNKNNQFKILCQLGPYLRLQLNPKIGWYRTWNRFNRHWKANYLLSIKRQNSHLYQVKTDNLDQYQRVFHQWTNLPVSQWYLNLKMKLSGIYSYRVNKDKCRDKNAGNRNRKLLRK